MLEMKGLVKLTEECGELIQIASKKMTRMDSDDHWDGAGKLSERLENEIADVIAACRMVTENFELDEHRILGRVIEKESLFRKWINEEDKEVTSENIVLPTVSCGRFG